MVFANKAMATRSHLEEQAAAWIAASGTTPPGNGVEQEAWEGTTATRAAAVSADDDDEAAGGPALDISLMSPAERAAYDEQRLKMRKAMVRRVFRFRVWVGLRVRLRFRVLVSAFMVLSMLPACQ
jgi:hypothetical protein